MIGLDPIDCSDPCHLSWLLKSPESPQLLNRIDAPGICANSSGIAFSALNLFDFNNNCCVCACN